MVDPKLLREVPFFHDLTDSEVAVMSGVVNRKDFKLGDTIFRESEDGASHVHNQKRRGKGLQDRS